MSTANSTYLFYDTETTGLNKCFDQVIQFAAIRTDSDLKELERYEINIKLLPDIIPAPEAIITHRIGIDNMQQGDTEFDAMQKIHALLNQPGTISVGYNTLGFDDEFLRFSFYRNLLPPYTHQFANQCGRMDIYPITAMYYLFNREALSWPTQDDKVSLKLENISQHNQLATGQAHDAMVDVEATLALARRLRKHDKMWHYLTGSFNKKTDLDRIGKLPFTLNVGEHQFQEGIMVCANFGYQNLYHAPVVGLGSHLHYNNQTLWLRLDQEHLSNSDNNTIAANTFVVRKKIAEQHIILPPTDRFQQHLSKQRKEITDKNRYWLKQNPALMSSICEYHQHFQYPNVPNVDPQAALYQLSFPSSQQEKNQAKFISSAATKKSAIIDTFNDPTRCALAHRIMARHFPKHASTTAQADYQQYCQEIQSGTPPIDFRGEQQRNTQQALNAIATLTQNTSLDAQQMTLLHELEKYLGTCTK